jgi:hypothetical protein
MYKGNAITYIKNFHNRSVKRYAHRVKDFVHAAELRQACARGGSFGRGALRVFTVILKQSMTSPTALTTLSRLKLECRPKTGGARTTTNISRKRMPSARPTPNVECQFFIAKSFKGKIII